MLKTHEKFHSENGKRLVLIVDDEAINRELLNLSLKDTYETVQLGDGKTALEFIREHQEMLSLIFLDLLMPGINGLDVLRTLKNDQELKDIPVIVMTTDREAEVASLQLGAADFIPKPYPSQEVILARVERSIELSEDRDIIHSTERDNLTGLYNREYFYRYAEQYDQHHPDADMDAIVIDVQHFRMINERYGKDYGDEVLRRIGEKVREMVRESGGIVSRRDADTFLVYCPHREDYEEILTNASVDLAGENVSGNRVRLRMGVYEHVERTIEMERRFDRAKMAADTVRGNYISSVAKYDSDLHESEIYTERLLEDFPRALQEREFAVFYQPKFNIRPEIPVLASAEALVRWKHPDGMISPGVFIPLFEENSLIQKLDMYVWREAAAQIKAWKDRFGISVPVSVNVSRIDMYDPDLIDIFQQILADNDLEPHELLLEITESAYTQDSEQIITTVNQLRSLGFKIEMDDFGTGYSSLNMISSLPIDALKLDMKFIRSAFREGSNTRLIEIIVDIAKYLEVPTIAEGVETLEQLEKLRELGCDLVQGFYFSKPVPAEEYERFVEEKKQMEAENIVEEQQERPFNTDVSDVISNALTRGFEVIYYVNTETGQYVEFNAGGQSQDLQIDSSGKDFFRDTARNIPQVVYRDDQERVALSMQQEALLAQLLGGGTFTMTYRLMIGDEPVYHNLRAVSAGPQDPHIVIGVSNVDDQIREAHGHHEGTCRSREFFAIAQALSSDFENIYYVDIITDAYTEFTARGVHEGLQIELSGSDFFRDCREQIEDVVYEADRDLIVRTMDKESLLNTMHRQRNHSVIYRLMIENVPVYYQMKIVMAEDQRHMVIGVSNVDAQMKRESELNAAREKANRDALTGVKSKYAYDEITGEINDRISRGENSPFAVVVCDVNGLKYVNDTQGHAAGDQLILDASRTICEIFKHSPVFRVGGDEFVVLLRGRDYEQRQDLFRQMEVRNQEKKGTSGTIVACGTSDWKKGEDTTVEEVFHKADVDMYRNKNALKE